MKIEIEGMSFGYAGVPVLEDITLSIRGPQLVSIIGPNGVGKSTFIHCINKILSPTAGTVLVNDIDVSQAAIKDLAKEIGYVPYSANTSFPLSVVDTVLMGRHPYSGWNTLNDDLAIVYSALRLLHIDHLAMRNFNELSAGQHQKVMIARGIVQEPKVLLLDEPTSNLDIKHQIEVTRILRELSQNKGILVIMISHDLNIAAKYSDHMIMMSEGRIFDVGTPGEVLTADNVKAVYDVDCRVIDDSGRPHIIMQDGQFDGCHSPASEECRVSVPKSKNRSDDGIAPCYVRMARSMRPRS